MKLRLKMMIAGLFVIAGATLAPLASTTSALEVTCDAGSGSDCNLVKTKGNLDTRVWYVVRTALGIMGGVAVIMIIIGGILYVLSNGDPGKAKTAKNTILYAVIGLVVAMSASAIVVYINNAVK